MLEKVPRISLLVINSVDSEYTNNAEDNKNCYLLFAAQNSEDCMYGRLVYRCTNCIDNAFLYDSDMCYECIDCRKCYKCLFSERCETSSDLLFCFDARDCQNCILSTNIRHEQYMIENVQHTKEEYEVKKKEILSSYDNLEQAKEKFNELRSQAFVKYSFQTKCNNAVGDYMYNCHDVWAGFDAENAKNCKYIADAEMTIDCYDMNNTYYKPELNLDIMGSLQTYKCKHSTYVMYCNNTEYSDSMHNCSNCFGCIGLRKKKYCILNKQYSEEEYKKLKEQMISDMKEQGVYGDFLPPAVSPFGYNETLAKEYFPEDEASATEKGFQWQHEATGIFGKETITNDNMPQTIEEVDDSILKEVLVDEKTNQNFRITAGELSFHRQMGIPLPRRSFETRHQDRMSKRNPRNIWKRKTNDGKEVWTTYAPDRPETILSEEEYQQRIE